MLTKIQAFPALIFLVLCSKWYFLFGFINGTWRPIAPAVMIMTRDVILGSLLSYLLFYFFKSKKPESLKIFLNREKSFVKLFSLFVLTALLVLGVQLSGDKTLAQIGQHYIRNILFPITVLPLAMLAFFFELRLNLKPILKYFTLLNVALSLLQIFFFKELLWINRPTGILGDPLLNASFILLGLLCFDLKDGKDKKLIWVFALPTIYVLSQAGSLSAIAAFVIAVILAYPKQSLVRDPKLLKRLSVGLFGIIALLIAFSFLPQPAEREGADAGIVNKVTALFQEKGHYSVQGRWKSNVFPVELCAAAPMKCLFGDSEARYHLLDSLWASMLVNWGVIFLVLYLCLFLIRPLQRLRKQKSDTFLLTTIFFFFWIFSLLNAGMYKYPLNVLFYLTVARIYIGSRRLPHP